MLHFLVTATKIHFSLLTDLTIPTKDYNEIDARFSLRGEKMLAVKKHTSCEGALRVQAQEQISIVIAYK